MPKHEIYHAPGRPLPPDLEGLLQPYFPTRTLERLERLGGRVTLAVVAPYVDRRGGAQRSGVLTQEEIADLTALKDRPEALRDGLDKLGLRDLQVLAEAIRQPVRPKITAAALRAACFERIRAEECWRRISSGV